MAHARTQNFNVPRTADGLIAYIRKIYEDRVDAPRLLGAHPDCDSISLAQLAEKLATPSDLGTRLDGLAFIAAKKQAVVNASEFFKKQFSARRTDLEKGTALFNDKEGALVKLHTSLTLPPTPELTATIAREISSYTFALDVFSHIFEEAREKCLKWQEDIDLIATEGKDEQIVKLERFLQQHRAYLIVNTPARLLSESLLQQQAKPLDIESAQVELTEGIKQYDNLLAQVDNAKGMLTQIAEAATSLPGLGGGAGRSKHAG